MQVIDAATDISGALVTILFDQEVLPVAGATGFAVVVDRGGYDVALSVASAERDESNSLLATMAAGHEVHAGDANLRLSYTPGNVTDAFGSPLGALADFPILNLSQTEDSPPATPTALASAAGPGRIDLSWRANSEPDLKDYVIYVSDSPTGTFDVLAVVAAGTRSYADGGLVGGSTRYYRVTARNTRDMESGPTEAVGATAWNQNSDPAYTGLGPTLLIHAVAIERNRVDDRTPAGAKKPNWVEVLADEPARVHVPSAETVARAGKDDMRSAVKVFFGRDVNVDEGCRIRWVDQSGRTRYIKVDSYRDMAGAGVAFVASGTMAGG